MSVPLKNIRKPCGNRVGNKRVIIVVNAYWVVTICKTTLIRASHVLTLWIKNKPSSRCYLYPYLWGELDRVGEPCAHGCTNAWWSCWEADTAHLASVSVLLPKVLWHLSSPWDWTIRESLEDMALVDLGGRGGSWVFTNRVRPLQLKPGVLSERMSSHLGLFWGHPSSLYALMLPIVGHNLHFRKDK